MSRKYTFSIQFGNETFQAEGFDSFDEAIKVVEKAVYDRKLQKGDIQDAAGGDKVLNKSAVRRDSLVEKEIPKRQDSSTSNVVLPPPEVLRGSSYGSVV